MKEGDLIELTFEAFSTFSAEATLPSSQQVNVFRFDGIINNKFYLYHKCSGNVISVCGSSIKTSYSPNMYSHSVKDYWLSDKSLFQGLRSEFIRDVLNRPAELRQNPLTPSESFEKSISNIFLLSIKTKFIKINQSV